MSQKIIDAISVNSLKPLYLVHGTEPYYVDQLVQKIIDIAIPDFEKGFNEYILFGKDITTGDIINYAKKFPMMADRQLVVVKEAHMIADLAQKENQTLLENYAKNPSPSTILVISFGKAQDERKTWVKSFSEKGIIHNFKKMYDNEVPNFIIEHCKDLSLKISPKAVSLLAEHLGNNLSTIHNEIQKIKLNIKADETVDAGVIENFVGISKEYNFFELQKAIIDRNAKKAFVIVDYFSKNAKDNPLPPNIILLYNFFSKLLIYIASKGKPDSEIAKVLGVNPYFLKDYARAAQNYNLGQLMRSVNALRIADQRSKGVEAGNMTESEIYKDLIFAIMH